MADLEQRISDLESLGFRVARNAADVSTYRQMGYARWTRRTVGQTLTDPTYFLTVDEIREGKGPRLREVEVEPEPESDAQPGGERQTFAIETEDGRRVLCTEEEYRKHTAAQTPDSTAAEEPDTSAAEKRAEHRRRVRENEAELQRLEDLRNELQNELNS